ncbi:hypothetical protein C8J57DRAFT_1223040 [Mycena rebaudengoi]|nr:hypothetical protein C8J57DRAFT_1223040 [Mycena rebaudengoi]
MALDTVTGALLIGTWANSFLCMAELIEAKYYFTHFKHDDWRLKAFVWTVLLIDIVSTVGDYACVYLYTITHSGNPTYLADQHWVWYNFNIPAYPAVPLHYRRDCCPSPKLSSRPILVVCAGICFLAYRFMPIVCLTQFGGSLACGAIITMFPAFIEREKVEIPATIWLVTEAVADLGVAAALLWEFRKARRTLVETRSVLDRLVAVTIQTGTATATLAVAALIAYLMKEESNVSVGIAYTLGRVYVLSMLANLNIRRSRKSTSVAIRGMSSAADPCTLTFTSIGIDDLYSSHSHSTVNPHPSRVDIGPQQDFPAVISKGSYTSKFHSRPERRMESFIVRRTDTWSYLSFGALQTERVWKGSEGACSSMYCGIYRRGSCRLYADTAVHISTGPLRVGRGIVVLFYLVLSQARSGYCGIRREESVDRRGRMIPGGTMSRLS